MDTHLRILYTINSSPQYILARSTSPTTTLHNQYATCPLKPCLDAICRSSPELVHDSATRDFSVYVLDPLESLSDPDNNARGVAVGLGLMSWAMLAEDDKQVPEVTGTLVTMPNGQQALEVILALRETSHMQKASLSPTLKSWGRPPATSTFFAPTAAPAPSTKHSKSTSSSRTKRSSADGTVQNSDLGLELGGEGRFEALVRNLKKAHEEVVKDSSTSSTSSSQAPAQTQPTRYARSSDFQLSNSEIWCGPPRQKVGRPPKNKARSTGAGAGAGKEKGKERDKNRGLFTREPLVRTLGSSSASATNGIQTQTQTEQMTLLSLLTALTSHPQQGTTNEALLSTLGAIDSSSTSSSSSGEEQPNVALVNALKELLASAAAGTSSGTGTINPALITNSQSNANSTTIGEGGSEAGEGEDEIIVLDKENVNPGAFRRKGEKGKGGEGGHHTDATREKEKERVGFGERSNAGNMRKRTLSDFMEEKEAEREREKRAIVGSRKRAIPSSTTSTSTTSSSSSSIQHTRSDTDYPFSSSTTTTTTTSSRIFSNSVLTANLAFRPHTSPPRPTFGSGRATFQRAISFGGSTAGSSSSAANSPTPTPDALPAATAVPNPPKKYVVPAWARTNTTTQPRLSEEVLAQRAAAAAAAATATAEAEAEKERTKKRGRGGKRKSENDNNSKDKDNKESEGGVGTKKKQQQRVQIDLYSSLPVCASSDVTVVSPSSPLPVSSPAAAAAPTSEDFSDDPSCPKTPPPLHRRRHTLTPLSKNVAIIASGSASGSALFTPTPRKLSGLFNSPLFSPSASIASMKGKLSSSSKISPIRAVTSGEGWDVDPDEDEDEEEEERLSRELDDALEERSLPIASSDFDTAEFPPTSSSSSGGHISAAEEDETMRYWSTGLPPSSPPPPTSPVLQSQTDDEDMDDISNAMSDSDALIFERDPLDQQEQQEQQFFSGMSSDYINSDIPFSDDLAMCFDDLNQFLSDPMTGDGTFIINNNEDTSSLLPLPSSDPVVQNGINDFDFTQFWESVKPLVDQSMVASSSLTADGLASDGMMHAESGGEIDHVKLAEEVHALFSGCLM